METVDGEAGRPLCARRVGATDAVTAEQDRVPQAGRALGQRTAFDHLLPAAEHHVRQHLADDVAGGDGTGVRRVQDAALGGRSEEHTSELQSLMRLSYAVSSWKKKK